MKGDQFCDGVVQRKLCWTALALEGKSRPNRHGSGVSLVASTAVIPFDSRSEIGNVTEAFIYGSADLDDFFKRDHNVFSIGIAVGYVEQRLQFSAQR